MRTRSSKPSWLKIRIPSSPQYEQTRRLLRESKLHTVCQEAGCPNMFECFSRHTATFLILGAHCTRNCAFCAVSQGPLLPPSPDEPRRVALAAAELDLKYVVVTSVTRDDLADGGASQFAAVIDTLREVIADVQVEVLIPDFQGDGEALAVVLAARPDVLNHNIETVPRLYPTVRPQAVYERTIALLENAFARAPGIPTKSGLMLGLGETETEVRQVLTDLRRAHCRLLTIGQYLQPTPECHPVVRYVPPDEFDLWRRTAMDMGFAEVAAGPFVRSSYRAEKSFAQLGRCDMGATCSHPSDDA